MKLVIDLSPPGDVCVVCEAAANPRKGIPMYEGDVVPNDWNGDWAGYPACDRCFAEQEKLTEPIDRDFLRGVVLDHEWLGYL